MAALNEVNRLNAEDKKRAADQGILVGGVDIQTSGTSALASFFDTERGKTVVAHSFERLRKAVNFKGDPVEPVVGDDLLTDLKAFFTMMAEKCDTPLELQFRDTIRANLYKGV